MDLKIAVYSNMIFLLLQLIRDFFENSVPFETDLNF